MKKSHLWADIVFWLGLIVIGFTAYLPMYAVGIILILVGIWIEVRYKQVGQTKESSV